MATHEVRPEIDINAARGIINGLIGGLILWAVIAALVVAWGLL